jgi:hypothetical protein
MGVVDYFRSQKLTKYQVNDDDEQIQFQLCFFTQEIPSKLRILVLVRKKYFQCYKCIYWRFFITLNILMHSHVSISGGLVGGVLLGALLQLRLLGLHVRAVS